MKKSLLLVLILGLFLGVGCQKKDDEETPVAPPPPQGDADSGFSAALKYYAVADEADDVFAYRKTYMRQMIHKGTSTFTEECKAEAGEDITCIVETDELDLYYYGTGIAFNVPPDMCEYVTHTPYLFYGLSVGNGSSIITVDTVGTQTGSDLNNDGDLGDANELDDPTKCQYDHSPDGPNCCEGTYRRINRTWNGAAYDIDSTTTGNSWGGDASLCIDGPAKYISEWPKDKKGIPYSKTLWTYGVGSLLEYQIFAPSRTESGGPRNSNVFGASWYDIADHGGGAPTAYLSGDEIACKDRDGELIARINLFVREWNTKAAFDAMTDNPDDHSLGGFEDAPFTAEPNNDRADWKDFGNGYPGLPDL